MSDESRPEVEAEVHASVGLEEPGPAVPELEPAGDEEPDFEAHGPVGLGPGAMGPAVEGPKVE